MTSVASMNDPANVSYVVLYLAVEWWLDIKLLVCARDVS